MLWWTGWRAMRRLERNARSSRAELLARQRARFADLVAFVTRRSPYYRRIVEERGLDPATARPEDFPPLTKDLLIEHLDEIATDPRIRRDRLAAFLARSRDPGELYEGRFHVLHTSGTSGTVCTVACTRREWVHAAAQFRRLVSMGWRRRVAYVGATGGHFAGVSFAVAPTSAIARLFYVTRAFEINRPMADVLAALARFRPHFLTGYARALRMVAEQQECGALDIRPKAVFSGGETLTPGDRAFLERVWGAQVRNMYATTEHLHMAFERRAVDTGGRMYLLEDDLILEPTADALYVTNLFNRTVPLIRHRMDDVLRVVPGRHHGPYRVIEGPVARLDHMPYFRNERGARDAIHPNVLVEFYVPGLRTFQMRLRDEGSFRFLVVLEPGLDDARREAARAGIRRRLDELLAEKDMRNVRYDVDEVDTIGDEGAKFRLVVPVPAGGGGPA